MVLSPRITAGFIIRPRLLRRAAEHVSDWVFIHALGIPACRIAGRTLRIIVIRVAPREGSDIRACENQTVYGVSIHAPREGSDPRRSREVDMQLPISIHAPREGSDGSDAC